MTAVTRTPKTKTVMIFASSNPNFWKIIPTKLDKIRIAVDFNVSVTEKRGKQAIVSISDDGNGIADEIKPRIFDMFYSGANQIADSRRSLGLGLSLCKSIINAHGGELTVSDNLPHGTVFTFTLPAGEVKVYE